MPFSRTKIVGVGDSKVRLKDQLHFLTPGLALQHMIRTIKEMQEQKEEDNYNDNSEEEESELFL